MSQYLQCLKSAAATKAITPTQLEKAEARFEGLRQEYEADGMAPMDAAIRAADEATEKFALENREVKRRRLNQMRSNIQVWNDLQRYKDPLGKNWRGWRGLVDLNDGAPFDNYARLKDHYQGLLFAHMDGILQKFKPKFAGAVRPIKGQINLLREIFGEDTGDAEAKALARAWKETHETAVKIFRTVGGSIGELENWHLPQKQDWLKLYNVPRATWVDDHMRWVDWDKTRRSDGTRVRTVEERRKFLEEAYDTLVTDGGNKYSVSGGRIIKGFSNKLDKHRVLQFRNSDSWMRMHTKYGAGQIFDVLMNHVEDMSHEIAMTHRFGPSPPTTFSNIQRMIRKMAPTPGEAQNEIRKLEAVAANLMRETGLARTNKIGNFLAGTRNLLTSALLGSASLIAIPSDINLSLMAKRFNRLEGTQFIRRYMSLMNPASSADRQLAVRLGLGAEYLSAEAYGVRRFLGFEMSGPSWTRRTANVFMNLSLLSPHTQMAKWAFGFEMLGLFADYAGKSFDQLPFKTMFERHGITPAEWDRFRSIQKYEERGATFLRPDDLIDPRDRGSIELASKFKAMVLDETRIAVPDVNILSRNFLVGGTDPGTFAGELVRSAAMFKNFPITFMFTIMRRYLFTALNEKGGKATTAWFSYLIISMTLLGALRNQATNIAQGNDPQDMSDPKFWGHSLMTGGGLGIMGDFVFSDYNRFGFNPISSIAGPVAQLGGDVGKLTVGNARKLLEGEETNFMSEFLRFGQRYAPGSRNWWSRLWTDRLLWDGLIKLTDPDADNYFDRQAKRRERDYGLTQWWERGQSWPSRKPDLSRAFRPPDG